MSSREHLDWKRVIVELATIIVGVLIALGVDQWNDARLDRIKERRYLSSLAADLQDDITELDSAALWIGRHRHAATQAAKFVQTGQPSEPDSIVKHIQLAGWQYPIQFAVNTISELRSTGNLQLLRNAELKRQIGSYYALLDFLKAVDRPNQDRVWEDYDRFVKNVLGPYPRLRVIESLLGPVPSFNSDSAVAPPIDSLRSRLRTLPDIDATLGEIIFISYQQQDNWDMARTAAVKLREAIGREVH